MKAKNCLIFGGSGQIGSHLIRKLTKNNYKVTVVTRSAFKKGNKIKKKVMQAMLILLKLISLMKKKLESFSLKLIFVLI